MKICFLYNFLVINKQKLNLYFFDYNDVRAFQVFKWTTGCNFKCETKKVKLAKNIKKWIFKQKTLLYDAIFYRIIMLFEFLKISHIPL